MAERHGDETLFRKLSAVHRRHIPEPDRSEDHGVLPQANGTLAAGWRSERLEEFPPSHVHGLRARGPHGPRGHRRVPATADLEKTGLHDLWEGRRGEGQCGDHRTETVGPMHAPRPMP